MQTNIHLHARVISAFGSAIALCICLMTLLTLNILAPTSEKLNANLSEPAEIPSN